MTVIAVTFVSDTSPTVPDQPTDLARDEDLTDSTQVSFTWVAPENDGGENIIDYTVLLKNEDGFEEIASELTSTAFTFASGVTTGTTYSFQVKARNSVGYSNSS